MECRCYHGGEGRTRMRQLAYARIDAVTFAIGGGLLVAVSVLALGFGL